MKSCTVEATFTKEGQAHPRKLVWDGQALFIAEVGRHWTSDDGQHMLVKVPDGRTFELLYNGAHWQGKVVSAPPNFA